MKDFLGTATAADQAGTTTTGGRGRAATTSSQAGTATAGGEADTAAELLAAISAVRRTARRAVRQRWHAEPLPMAQGELLRLVAAQPGISVAEAAGELRLAPNTVSTLVGRLVTDGLLTRGRVVADGRAVRLSVTAKARQRLASYRDLRAELTRSAMARLAPADVEALASVAPVLLRLAEATVRCTGVRGPASRE